MSHISAQPVREALNWNIPDVKTHQIERGAERRREEKRRGGEERGRRKRVVRKRKKSKDEAKVEE